MALPLSLRNSITPPELELIASEELIEIVPLISMERTAFISVRPTHPRDCRPLNKVTREHMAPYVPQTKQRSLYGWP
jgi:hypothetical protein